MTIAQCAEGWLDEKILAGECKEQTCERYRRIVYGRLVPEIGEEDIRTWTEERARKYFALQQARGNKRTGGALSCGTMNLSRTVMNGIFRYAVKKRQAQTNPIDGITRPKGRKKKTEVFDRTEQRALNAEFDRRIGRYIGYKLALYTGMRIGEIVALKWADVDVAEGVIRVRATAYYQKGADGRYEKRIGTPKTESSAREIPVPKKLLGELKKLRKTYPERKYVLENSRGETVCIRSYQKSFELLQKRCGIKVRNFHAMRHTYATRLLELGTDFKTVSELLGHESPQVTMQIYGHTLMQTKRNAVRKLDELI